MLVEIGFEIALSPANSLDNKGNFPLKKILIFESSNILHFFKKSKDGINEPEVFARSFRMVLPGSLVLTMLLLLLVMLHTVRDMLRT